MLTVIIPAKNEGKYIRGCLLSVIRAIEVYGHAGEVILVDNGSTDNTTEIAREYDCRVIKAPHESIGGLRNLGVKNANGEVLAFLDADCIVAPEWMAYCLQNFDDETIAMVGTRAVPDFENATWVERAWFRLFTGAPRQDFVAWLGTSNLFVRKDVFLAVGGFDESLRAGEDVDLCYKIGRKRRILLEKRINTLHLRESKTLVELFKRECYRGQDSLKSLFKDKFDIRELPSIVVPAVNLLAIIFLVPLLMMESAFVFVPVLMIVMFPLILLIKKKMRRGCLRENLECYVISMVYILARSYAFVYELRRSFAKAM